MPVTTANSFLDVLEKSQLLSADKIAEFRETFGDQPDPKTVARQLIKNGSLNKWQALQVLNGRFALRIGKYKLLDQIDSDRAERVFLAEHSQMGRQVAIKTLSRQHVAKNPEAVQEFLRHAAQISALDHPNIIHVYDVDNIDDRYHLIMEHVEGRNLRQVVEEDGPLPFEKAARVIGQAADALAYATEHDFVHGDIRPGNLMLDNHQDLKILNLGTNALGADSGIDQPAGFLAPEQGAQNGRADHRSDVYSLGCVMYFLLTGHPPLVDHAPSQQGAADHSALLRKARPDVPELFISICDRMMKKNPSERFPSSRDVKDLLDKWQSNGESGATKSAAVTDADNDTLTVDDPEVVPADDSPMLALPEVDDEPTKETAAFPGIEVATPKRKAKPNEKEPIAAKSAVPEKPKPAGKQPKAAGKPTPSPATKPKAAPGTTKTAARTKKAAPVPAKEQPAANAKGRQKVAEKPVTKQNAKVDVASPGKKQPAAGGLVINTESKGRRKVRKKSSRGKKAVAATSAAAATETPADDATEPAATVAKGKKPPLGLIIGGAIGGGLLLVAGLVVGMMFLLGGNEQPDEDNTTVAQATGDGTDNDQGPANPTETNPGESNPAETNPGETNPAETNPAETNPAETNPGDTNPPATDPPDVDPTPTPTTEPNEPPAKPPSETPDEPTEVAKVDNVPPTTPPAGTGDTKPPETPAENKPPAKKPPVNNPSPKKKPAGKPKKPFQDLPERLALPDVAAGGPASWNHIFVPEGELCFIRLRGGTNAIKGSPGFVMRNGGGGLDERDWEVFFKDGEADSGTKIAHLSLNEKDELSFQWQPAAQQQPLAVNLQNCALSMSCAGEAHVVTFREATPAEALVIDLDLPVMKTEWNIDAMPDPERMKVEITGVDQAKYTIDPIPQMEANKGKAMIRLEDGGGMLSLQVETALRRSLSVTVTPFLKPTSDARPERFNARKMEQVGQQLNKEMQGWATTANQLKQFAKQRGLPAGQKRLAEQRAAQADQMVTEKQTALQQFQQVEQVIKTLSGNAKIKFRVYYDADSSEVNLVKAG